MPDLADGASAAVQGSSGHRYLIKNVAGVYSCSCPAWRNQSLPIDHRTCKHIRAFRGEAVEAARIGSVLPVQGKEAVHGVQAPPLLLAETWDGHSDLSGWWMSEKLDGVRAYWNGTVFLSRQGNRYFAPDWFTAGLPAHPLDGELWLGRKLFQRAVSIVRRQDGGDLWREVRFRVFDAPQVSGTFEDRLKFAGECLAERRPAFAQVHEHVICSGASHLRDELARVESLGGEGLMLRQPGSRYEAGRSATLLKVKSFHDAEARVIEHQPGSGRHKGRLGALLVELTDGTRFAVGTGLSDSERENPPPVGSIITFRFQELTDAQLRRRPAGDPHSSTERSREHGQQHFEQVASLRVRRRQLLQVLGSACQR